MISQPLSVSSWQRSFGSGTSGLGRAHGLEGNPADSDAMRAWNECTRLSDAVREAYSGASEHARLAGVLSKLDDAMDAHTTFMGFDTDEVGFLLLGHMPKL